MSNLPSDVEEDLAVDDVDGCLFGNGSGLNTKAFELGDVKYGMFKSSVPCSERMDSGVCVSTDDGYSSIHTTVSGLDNVSNLFQGLRVTDGNTNLLSTNSISLSKHKLGERYISSSSSGVQESCSEVSPSIIDQESLKCKNDLDRFDSGCVSESIDLLSKTENQETFKSPQPTSIHNIPNLYVPDEDGDTDVHNSIIQGKKEVSMNIINLAFNYELLNHQNNLSQTPLHLAVLTNQPEVVRRLIVGGAQVDIRDHKGNTALHIACQKGYHHIAKHLLTPVLYTEIKINSYEIPYQKLPQDLEIRNYDGLSCLHLAALGNHYDCMKLLLENRAPINIADGKSGRTVLHYAAEHGNVKMLHFVLSQPNADINKKTYGGLTAIALADGRGYVDAVKFLYNHGADTSGMDESQEDSDEDMDTMYDDIQIAGEPVFT